MLEDLTVVFDNNLIEDHCHLEIFLYLRIVECIDTEVE